MKDKFIKLYLFIYLCVLILYINFFIFKYRSALNILYLPIVDFYSTIYFLKSHVSNSTLIEICSIHFLSPFPPSSVHFIFSFSILYFISLCVVLNKYFLYIILYCFFQVLALFILYYIFIFRVYCNKNNIK